MTSLQFNLINIQIDMSEIDISKIDITEIDKYLIPFRPSSKQHKNSNGLFDDNIQKFARFAQQFIRDLIKNERGLLLLEQRVQTIFKIPNFRIDPQNINYLILIFVSTEPYTKTRMQLACFEELPRLESVHHHGGFFHKMLAELDPQKHKQSFILMKAALSLIEQHHIDRYFNGALKTEGGFKPRKATSQKLQKTPQANRKWFTDYLTSLKMSKYKSIVADETGEMFVCKNGEKDNKVQGKTSEKSILGFFRYLIQILYLKGCVQNDEGIPLEFSQLGYFQKLICSGAVQSQHLLSTLFVESVKPDSEKTQKQILMKTNKDKESKDKESKDEEVTTKSFPLHTFLKKEIYKPDPKKLVESSVKLKKIQKSQAMLRKLSREYPPDMESMINFLVWPKKDIKTPEQKLQWQKFMEKVTQAFQQVQNQDLSQNFDQDEFQDELPRIKQSLQMQKINRKPFSEIQNQWPEGQYKQKCKKLLSELKLFPWIKTKGVYDIQKLKGYYRRIKLIWLNISQNIPGRVRRLDGYDNVWAVVDRYEQYPIPASEFAEQNKNNQNVLELFTKILIKKGLHKNEMLDDQIIQNQCKDYQKHQQQDDFLYFGFASDDTNVPIPGSLVIPAQSSSSQISVQDTIRMEEEFAQEDNQDDEEDGTWFGQPGELRAENNALKRAYPNFNEVDLQCIYLQQESTNGRKHIKE